MMHIRSAFIRLATLGLDGCPLDIVRTYPVVRRGNRSGTAQHVSTEMRTRLGEINRVDSGAGHFLRFFQSSMDGGCGLAEVYNFPLRMPSFLRLAIPTMLRDPVSPTSPMRALARDVPISTAPIILLIMEKWLAALGISKFCKDRTVVA